MILLAANVVSEAMKPEPAPSSATGWARRPPKPSISPASPWRSCCSASRAAGRAAQTEARPTRSTGCSLCSRAESFPSMRRPPVAPPISPSRPGMQAGAFRLQTVISPPSPPLMASWSPRATPARFRRRAFRPSTPGRPQVEHQDKALTVSQKILHPPAVSPEASAKESCGSENPWRNPPCEAVEKGSLRLANFQRLGRKGPGPSLRSLSFHVRSRRIQPQPSAEHGGFVAMTHLSEPLRRGFAQSPADQRSERLSGKIMND